MPIAPPISQDASVEARVFWLRFQKAIMAALVVVLLGITGFAAYRLYVNHRSSAAADLLGSAKTVPDYQQVISQYAETPAGATAYFLLAENLRREKKFDQANTTLRTFLEKNPDHQLAPTAKMAIASNLEAMGKTDEALSTYREIAAKYSNDYNGPLAMISEVPLLKAKNRIDDARRLCEEILTKYRMPGQQAAAAGDDRSESIWAVEAMRYLRTFKLPEQPKAVSVAPNSAAPKPPPFLAAPTAPPAAAGPVSSGAPTPKQPK